ncbi:hypothetical protein L7F22_066344 [Adiantum nelumboides]|nr:hypothetical protein [Adiantum nelumboides]
MCSSDIRCPKAVSMCLSDIRCLSGGKHSPASFMAGTFHPLAHAWAVPGRCSTATYWRWWPLAWACRAGCSRPCCHPWVLPTNGPACLLSLLLGLRSRLPLAAPYVGVHTQLAAHVELLASMTPMAHEAECHPWVAAPLTTGAQGRVPPLGYCLVGNDSPALPMAAFGSHASLIGSIGWQPSPLCCPKKLGVPLAWRRTGCCMKTPLGWHSPWLHDDASWLAQPLANPRLPFGCLLLASCHATKPVASTSVAELGFSTLDAVPAPGDFLKHEPLAHARGHINTGATPFGAFLVALAVPHRAGCMWRPPLQPLGMLCMPRRPSWSLQCCLDCCLWHATIMDANTKNLVPCSGCSATPYFD